MVSKKCPHCGRESYSAFNNPNWVCPYCDRIIWRTFGEPGIPKKKSSPLHKATIKKGKI